MSNHGMLGKLSLSDVLGLMSDLWQKLASPNGPEWLAEFKKFLRKEISWSMRPAWRTIWLPAFTESYTLAMLEKNRISISPAASRMLSGLRYPSNTSEEDVDFINMSVQEMGFTEDRVSYSQVCKWVKEHGELCKPTDAAWIRVRYIEQSKAELLVLAMETIEASDNEPYFFSLRRVFELELHAMRNSQKDSQGIHFRGEQRFVFRR
jgi:hypothetical protein